MSAQPRTTDEPSPAVPWLVGAFYMVAIIGFGGLLAYVVVGHWTADHWLVAALAALAAVVVFVVRMGRG